MVFSCDEETFQNLVFASQRSGRLKSTEVQLRVDDHLVRFPSFYDVQDLLCEKGEMRRKLFLRFNELTNKMLIQAKNKSGRSKTLEVYLRLKHHLSQFPDFYSAEVDVVRRSESVNTP